MSVYNVRADDFTDRKLAFETHTHRERVRIECAHLVKIAYE